jgi:hypothetical protein
MGIKKQYLALENQTAKKIDKGASTRGQTSHTIV